ncbi:MAG: hypothetical protein ACREOP_06785 [Thermodesulfobacteriota bacterium]
METIGKVLSITLLTIFGSAAATVYLIDSNIVPSYLDKPAVVYTLDTKAREKPADLQNVASYRERERIIYAEEGEVNDEPEERSDVKPIWGQGYDTYPASSLRSEERARELADYWNNQYYISVKTGNRESADKAFRNYSEYTKALGIKQSSDR